MSDRLEWDRDGGDWPHRDASRFVDAAGLRWHVQQFSREGPPSAEDGPAPLALLLHGTGASSHSWHPMLSSLRPHFDLLAIDLPGHAYSGMASAWQASLPGMAQAVHALLDVLSVRPQLVIGHSAGAALGARLCLDGLVAPRALVSINGAFLPLGGVAGVLFPPVAKLMASLPFVPGLVARRAHDRGAIERLVSGTGSVLDAAGTAWYAQLVGNPGHVAGALAMMANWDVRPLVRDLPRLQPLLALIAADRDRAVPAWQARRVQALCADPSRVSLTMLHGLGHLAHEENPPLVAAPCLAVARAVGLLSPL